ncbi:MAG TPA: FecR domain-containing protein [Gemmatimonadaceae bacterium]|jgi:transmembrane sensor|nr:FecR domain-containing protein [Gemmatimonadaceae bacterium]
METKPPGGSGDLPRPLDVRDLDPALLDRYLTGAASPDDIAQIDAVCAAHPAVRDGLARLQAAMAAVADGPTFDGAELAARARAIRGQGEGGRRATRVTALGADDQMSRRHGLRLWSSGSGHAGAMGSWWARAAIAAAIVVAIGTGVVIGSARRLGLSAGPVREYATAAGERLNVTLSDGTQFALAPTSRLRVPVAYGRSAREVVLEGEAFFRVVRDDARPFRVRAGGATTTDVGTAFDVRAYASDTAVQVAVAEGRVAFAATGAAESVQHTADLLAAGDVAVLTANGHIGRSHEADLAAYIGWTRGELMFRDAPLRDVVPVLARWYGVTITVADPALGRQLVRATFDMQSMTEVLTSVTSAVGAHYTQDGRAIRIVPNRPSR